MREIKFRAWDEKLKKMFVPNHIDGYGVLVTEERHEVGEGMFGTHPIEYPNPYVLMQFTGLKDKSGKEIYEGDIVQTDAGNIETRWHPHGYWIGTLGKVIGNIYENRELLQ